MLKVPDSCRDLDLARVSRVLTRHRAYFPTAARELGVSPADLKRMTWAKPHLLDDAHEEMELVVDRAQGALIDALFSGDERREIWAADRILSSWMARDHPFSPARGTTARSVIVTRFEEKPGETMLERDGNTVPVPRYDCGDDCPPPPLVLLEPEREPLQTLPIWPGPGLPPPLVARLYASPPMIAGVQREAPAPRRPAVLRRRLRVV
jgi:hypothetical protein